MNQTPTLIIFLTGAALLNAQVAPAPKTFATPEVARDALVQAAAKGLTELRELMGPGSSDILTTGDPVEDKNLLGQFTRRVAEKAQIESDAMNPERVTVAIGNEEWPFAVPIVKKNGRWSFDAKEGRAEIRRRIVGANELDAIEVCRGYVEAQEQYASKDWDGNGVLEYAKKIASTPGKKDGLYWPGEDSPIGEAIARAISQGYTSGSQSYHGYRYKVLLAQGPAAIDGEQDYLVHGLMIGGFALVAWPTEYGTSGIMTFIVNQDGSVYQKDLGSGTTAMAGQITKFNPDKTWTLVPDDEPNPSQ